MRLFVILSLVGLIGCRPTPKDDDLLRNMVVQTKFNANTAYSFYSSFTLSPDTLGYISNASKDTLLLGIYASLVTNTIKNRMSNAGFTYLNKKSNPDLGFATYVVKNYNVSQQINYPTYYSGYYGYGYGGYYGVPYVSTYISSTTTMIINLIDLKNRDAQNRLIVIWSAYIADIEKSPDQDGKIVEAINQAFEQSPYIKKP